MTDEKKRKDKFESSFSSGGWLSESIWFWGGIVIILWGVFFK